MARTLPWLKTASTTTAAPLSRPKPSKRRKFLTPDSDSDTPHLPPSPKKRSGLLPARSPSTSPPPAPPSEELMRPGLQTDDIYIMVEDEFLSTARTFTAHLHHAEYVRLKTEARTRNAGTISTISRPVDSITTMRAETKRKKQAEAQEARTKAGLEKIIPKSSGKAGDGSEESEFDPNEGLGGPWQGTQLQCFMTTSPRRALTGLTGLQGVTANTRAAAGFSKPERRVGSPTPNRKERGREAMAVGLGVDDDTSESDDDDLDARSRAPSRAPVHVLKPQAKHKAKVDKAPNRPARKAKPPSPPRPPPKRSFLDMSPISKPVARDHPSSSTLKTPPPEKKTEVPIGDDYSEQSRAVRSRDEILARRSRMKAKRQKQDMNSEAGIKGDEIPIFLV